MRILLIHNHYQSLGGEDSVFENEKKSLIKAGHEVLVYTDNNIRINSFLQKVLTAFSVIYSFKSARKIRSIIQSENPDIVHVHNFFPLISPSVFWVCQEQSIPVVHTLHNFRSICPTALLFHDGEIIEKSVKKSAWWTLRKKVYKKSFFGTLTLILSVEFHKYFGTWRNKVDAFIALSDFSKDKFLQAGWPPSKIHIKPNYTVPKTGGLNGPKPKHKKFALFVGRLSEEKGIEFLVNAWSKLDYQLYIVGSGPLSELVNDFDADNITCLGQVEPSHVRELMVAAKCLVMTSTWYEGFPMVLTEAFESSLPAIVPNLGSMGTIIEHDENGLKYDSGSESSFSEMVNLLFENQNFQKKLSNGARNSYVSNYSELTNVSMLLKIYKSVIQDQKNKLN